MEPDASAICGAIDPSKQIRVLVLAPGSLDDPISGNFETVTFHGEHFCPIANSIEWEAISYTWGGQAPTIPIHIDGRQTLVTPNVTAILEGLRHPTKTRNLWIDSVCINQSDLNERSQQIAFMLHVYKNAKSVIIWLQEQRDELHACAAAVTWMENILSKRDRVRKKLAKSERLRNCFARDAQDRGVRYLDMRPFMRLLNNDWFTRAWVFQESAVARDLLVHMGGDLISWNRLVVAVIRFVSDFESDEALSLPLSTCYKECVKVCESSSSRLGLTMIYAVHRIRSLRESSARMLPPSEVMSLIAGRKVTIGQDAVFALNGLFQLWDYRFPNDVDYTTSTTEELLKFTFHCIKYERNLDVIAQIRHPNRDAVEGLRMPSWALDWTSPKLGWYQLALPSIDALFGPAPRSIAPDHEPFCGRSCRLLRLRGFVIDEIGARDTSPAPLDVSDSQLERINRMPRFWRDGNTPHTNNDLGDKLFPKQTKGGTVAFTCGYERFSGSLVCCVYGSRHPILLTPNKRASTYRLAYGVCIVDGFEDGLGVEKAQNMGLKVSDFFIE